MSNPHGPQSTLAYTAYDLMAANPPKREPKMTTWRQLLREEMAEQNDSFDNIEISTLDKAGLDRAFDNGFGAPKGSSLTVWTKTRVYFPTVYDGSEDVGSVSRHPDGENTQHSGGW